MRSTWCFRLLEKCALGLLLLAGCAPEIGDEFAAARALADLAQRLREVANEEAIDLDGEASHGW